MHRSPLPDVSVPALDLVQEAFFRLDAEGRFRAANAPCERLFGRAPGSLLGECLWCAYPEAARNGFRNLARAASDTGEMQHATLLAGEGRWFDVRIFPDPDGVSAFLRETTEEAAAREVETNDAVRCIGRNVTCLRGAQARIRESEERYRLMVEGSEQIFFYVHDAEHRFEYVSPSVAAVLGYSADHLVGRPYDLILADGTNEVEVHDRTHALLESGVGPNVYVALTRHRLGHIVPLELVETMVTRDGGSSPWVQGFARDITERHRAESALREAALRDPLTGLPNRTLFMQHLIGAIETASTRGERLAVVFLDLDRFKLINDSAGHGTGDRLLQTVAERIQAALQPEDILARLGGDEFAILRRITGYGDAALDRLLERVRSRLSAPVPLSGVPDMFVTAAVGVAFGDGSQSAETLLAQADMAMYRAKRSGSTRYRVYDRTMRAETVERLTMETDLRHAINRREMHLAYQPMVCLHDGGIVGMEALARWTHPERGPICPADFIPIAEDTGLIHPLGEWVLREACRQIQLWSAVSDASVPFTVSVNLSPRQVADGDLAERISRICHRAGTAPSSLAVEITEGMLLDNVEAAADVLKALRAIGVRIYMDDFGTGYSSLSYLARLPIDAIKIDRSFVQGMSEGGRSRQIVSSILALASALGIPAVAEGIDHPGQLAELRDMGCHFGQGYLFSAPLPADGAQRLLADKPQW